MEKIYTENINQTLEERKQEALQTTEKCRQILLEKGAKEVILFGSLSGESPWHWQSDLDLAVRGMSEKQQWEAYSLLEKITPNWLKIDLVALEEIPDFVCSRILEEKTMPTNKYLALKTRIEDEMIALEQNCQALKQLIAQAETIPEIALTPALSSYVCDFYAGFPLPDEPVENNLQPLLAAALRESLELAGLILESMVIASNVGLKDCKQWGLI